MIPPLWPWKVLMLPARGPRPALKGEEPMQLRLMDDIVVPRNLSASIAVPRNLSGSAFHPDRPPYASSNSPKSIGYAETPQAGTVQQSAVTEKPAVSVANENIIPAAMAPSVAAPAPATELPSVRVTTLVLKSNQVLEVTKYRIDGGQLNYHDLNGGGGSVSMEQIDWPRTTQMTAETRSVDLPVVARQTN